MADPRSADWVADFFRAADRKEIDALAQWFADDIELRFANNPPIHGKAAARAVMEGFYGTITGMRHAREHLIVDGDTAAQHAVVTYTRPDGREVPLPVASYLRRTEAGPLDRLWIYIDIAPLYTDAA